MTQQEAIKELLDYAKDLSNSTISASEIRTIQDFSSKAVDVIMRLHSKDIKCSTENYLSCSHWKENEHGCLGCTSKYNQYKP